jgi:hypothetical protein
MVALPQKLNFRPYLSVRGLGIHPSWMLVC